MSDKEIMRNLQTILYNITLAGEVGGGWSQINASIMAALVNVVWKKKSNPHQQFLQQEIE